MSANDNSNSLSATSSSFDSNNSFYSTDSSSSSAAFHVLDEECFDQRYAREIDCKIRQFIEEIGDDGLFKPLVNLPAVQVYSSVDPAAPFCFRTTAHFPSHTAQDAFALFLDLESRGTWDAMCHNISVLKQIDPLTFIYHLQLKASWPTTARDSLALVAFRKLSDGRYVSVAWSIVDDALCPPDSAGKDYIRMDTRISANLFTPTGAGFRLDQLIDGDPKGNIPSYLIKKVSSASFPATIEAIKRVLSGRKPVGPDYYNSLLVKSAADGGDNDNEIASALREISARLLAIENQIRNNSNANSSDNKKENSTWQAWAPLAISSISLLLLLNLNLRKK